MTSPELAARSTAVFYRLWPAFAAGLLGMALLGRALSLPLRDALMDDAFISFRYAANLAAGHGLVFNPGEPVEGYTNFLWTVIMAGCIWLGFDVELSAIALSALCTLGTLALLIWLGLRLVGDSTAGPLLALLPAALFVALGAQARYIVAGMETPLFTLLLAAALATLLGPRRPVLTGLLFGLAALTRPEGVLYAALAFGYLAIGARWSRRQLLLCGAIVGALVAAQLAWRLAYYGYPLPNTYYAKTAGFATERLVRGLVVLRQLLAENALWPLLLLALPALIRPRQPLFWLLGAWVGATLMYFVYVGGDFLVWFGPRFLMPVLPALLLLVAGGIAALLGRVTHRASRASALALLFALTLGGHLLWNAWPAQFHRLEPFAAQMRAWRELGLWMRANLAPGTTIATDAAGLIPFFSRLPSIDMFGLADAHIAHRTMPGFGSGTVAHEKYDPEYVFARRPGCIVSSWIGPGGEALAAGLPELGARFSTEYTLVAVAKARHGPPPPGQPWVLATRSYTPALHAEGYVSGLYCRAAVAPTTSGVYNASVLPQ